MCNITRCNGADVNDAEPMFNCFMKLIPSAV
jgi:hypothetical protein